MGEAAIISAVRTPIGHYIGALRDVPAYDLGALVLNEAVKRAKVNPAQVDDVFTDAPDLLWSKVLGRKGPENRQLSRMPYDPSTN